MPNFYSASYGNINSLKADWTATGNHYQWSFILTSIHIHINNNSYQKGSQTLKRKSDLNYIKNSKNINHKLANLRYNFDVKSCLKGPKVDSKIYIFKISNKILSDLSDIENSKTRGQTA